MRWAAASLAAALVLWVAAPPAAGQKEYRVRVVTDPEGASIRVDDPDADPVGQGPWDGTLPAGPFMLIVDLEGHEQLIEEIIVKKSRKRQTFELSLRKIQKGTLVIRGARDAEGASIKIDGKERGEVPGENEVAEGPHEVIIEKEGFKRFEQWIEVTGGKTSTLEVELEPLVDEVVEVKKPAEPAKPRLAPLVIASAGLEVAWRRWDYLNPRTMTARPFDANVVPMVRVAIEGYPLAGSGSAAARGAGVRLGAGLGLPPAADDGASGTIATSWSELEVGALYRYPVAESVGARLDVAYSRNAFGFDAGALANEVPDVDYRSVRMGGTLDVTRGKLSAVASVSYLALLSAGDTAVRFRSWTGTGLGVEAGAWYRVTSAIRAGLGFTYRRYAFDFVSEMGDTVEADGGTDIFVGTLVGAAYAY